MARYVSKSLMAPEIHRNLPRGSAVYRLYMGDVCIYVGATCGLRERLYNHKLRGHFDSIVFEEYDKEDLYWAERRWIEKFQPTHNKRRDGGYSWERSEPGRAKQRRVKARRLFRTTEVIAALRMAANVYEAELEVIDATHAYAQKFGGSPGCNVFRFLLEDACRLRGVTVENLSDGGAA